MIRSNVINFTNDKSGWVTSHERYEVIKLVKSLGFTVTERTYPLLCQCHIHDKYTAINRAKYYKFLGNNVSLDYYHGDPRINNEFLPLFKRLLQNSKYINKIRVPHSGIEDLLINSGISSRIVKIPIGINIDMFPYRNFSDIDEYKKKLNIPSDSFVVGSFQKDGNGWGDGNTPKLIKGPDILISTLQILNEKFDNLFVLLTGPSRGYTIDRLKKLNIKFKHFYLDKYDSISLYYRALDLYLVTSREEGGPKAILESMASGVPIISTPVGHALDMIVTGKNGFRTSSFSPDEIASFVSEYIKYSEEDKSVLLSNAREVSIIHSYKNQTPMWSNFFKLSS